MYVFLFTDECKYVQHQYVQHVYNISEVCLLDMQENKDKKRWCHYLRRCVLELCWAPANDMWLTEWSRLHGYPIDDSLVASPHKLGYGPMGTIISSRTTMLPAAKLLLSKNGRHSMMSVHCANSPDLKPTDNIWADIKLDLSRNTQRNILECEITIQDILNQIHTKSFSPTGPVNA